MKKNIIRYIAVLIITFVLVNLQTFTLYADDYDDWEEDTVEGRTIYATDYSSLEKAINSARENDTIILSRNISTSKQLVLKKDVSIIVDFNKKVYRYTGSKEAIVIKNGVMKCDNINLKSKNYVFSVGSKGSLCIVNGKSSGYLKNNGNLEIMDGSFNTSGTKKSKKDELIQNTGYLYITDGQYINDKDNCVYSKSGEVVLEGGTYTGKAKCDENSNYATICNRKNSDCKIIGDVNVEGEGNAILNEGTIRIEDGYYYSHEAGTIINEGDISIIDSAVVSNDKNSVAMYNAGKCRLNGTNIKGQVYNDGGKISIIYANIKSHHACLVNDQKGTITIKDGYYYSKNDLVLYNVKGAVTMAGGEMRASKNVIHNYPGATFKMTGGSIPRKSKYAAIYNMGNLYLYGGSIGYVGTWDCVINESGSTCKMKKSKIGYYRHVGFN